MQVLHGGKVSHVITFFKHQNIFLKDNFFIFYFFPKRKCRFADRCYNAHGKKELKKKPEEEDVIALQEELVELQDRIKKAEEAQKRQGKKNLLYSCKRSASNPKICLLQK